LAEDRRCQEGRLSRSVTVAAIVASGGRIGGLVVGTRVLREPAVGLHRDRRSGNGARCLSRVSREAAVARASAVLRAAGRSVVARRSSATVRRRWRPDKFSALQERATSSRPVAASGRGPPSRAGESASPVCSFSSSLGLMLSVEKSADNVNCCFH
jgi:hypothetical protein